MESLLHYAPKITQTGEDLATAVTAVRRELDGLGDFVGDSWMEDPFRAQYLPAQHAVLFSAAGLAYEIEAIGGGVEQMARTYGITEQQNSADAKRIQQTEAQYPTGRALQPPPSHHEEPTPPPPTPTPQPGTSPHPVTPQPHHPSRTPTPPLTSSPLTPQPRPGMKPTDHHIMDGGRTILGPWWPNTNTGRMREAATAWTHLTGALDNAWTELHRYTAYILADAQGPAADAFNDYVDRLTGSGHGALTQAIQVSQDLHDLCLYQAGEVDDTRTAVLETAAEFALTFALDQALSAFTAGSAEALETAITDGFVVRVVSLLQRLIGLGKKGTEILDGAGRLLSKAVVAGGKGLLSGTANLALGDELDKAFGKKPESESDAVKDDEGNFAAGFIGSLLDSGSGSAAAKAISLGKSLEESGDRVGAQQLFRISKHLDGLGPAAIKTYINHLVSTRQLTISPSNLLSSTIADKLSSALDKS